MIKILKNLKTKQWIYIVICIFFIVGQVWLDLKLPEYMSKITELLQIEGSEMIEILKNGGFMLLCALGSMISAVIVGYFAARVAAGLSKTLREKVFGKVMEFSMEEINNFSTASLITRSTNDITQVQMVVGMGLQAMVKAPILAVWAIMKISGKSWQWTAATGVSVGVLITMLIVLVIFAMPKFKIIQSLTDNLNNVTRENLTGLRVVRAYNAEQYQGKKFEKANNELMSTHLFTNRMFAIINPTMTAIMSGTSLAIYWIGAYLINEAQMFNKITLFSDMVVFMNYAVQVIMAFMLIAMIFVMVPRAEVSAKRINQVLETKLRIFDGYKTGEENIEGEENVEGEENIEGEIEFQNVSFMYPDAGDYVLHDISFNAHKGETVAFIGSTGSGKSTLINLIPRFFDATDGQVIVDGIDVKEYSQEELRKKIGFVSQKAILFSGDINDNIAYGDNIPYEKGSEEYNKEIAKAMEIAQGSEFVEKLDEGYNSLVAQGGANFSGGQKQRMSIARAIARKPEIYIFDDSFSALDYKTDNILRSTLKKEMKGATSLIVAQRIGTIKDADRIIVLEDGAIVGNGTHKELLKSCKTYQEIAYSQLSKEEIDNE